ncbi:uncharacterized protein LOC143560693 [Bidens hawaiensis]|uniref:uncharacterized protein LOC143560693 n=1 Tax=Bidens hawaiensis TaxID=980011 RepID=UPI00404B66CC
MPLSAFGIHVSTLHKHETNKNQVQLRMKMGNENKRYNMRYMPLVMIGDSGVTSELTPSDTIKEFYKCMNEKNVKRLESYLADDCFFEDYSFPKPFKGKKEVIRFLKQLTTGMGPNVEFHVSDIYEGGGDLIAGVNWHLEWKNKQVPFTRGCSVYRLTREGERLRIRNALVFVESPIKPGDLFLVLLKIVTSLFDAFPEATEWFFRSQKLILQVLLKIYSIFLVPFISPIVSFYVNLGKFIVRFVSIVLKILEWCSKSFTSED